VVSEQGIRARRLRAKLCIRCGGPTRRVPHRRHCLACMPARPWMEDEAHILGCEAEAREELERTAEGHGTQDTGHEAQATGRGAGGGGLQTHQTREGHH
jgi:hypothetical protein